MILDIRKKLQSSGIDYKSLLNTQLWLVGVDIRNGRLPLEIGFSKKQNPKSGFPYYSLEKEKERFDLYGSGAEIAFQQRELFFPRYHFLPKKVSRNNQDLAFSILRVCENFSVYQQQIQELVGLKHQEKTREQWLDVNSGNVWFEPNELSSIWKELGESVK